jgi:hypothetical protein
VLTEHPTPLRPRSGRTDDILDEKAPTNEDNSISTPRLDVGRSPLGSVGCPCRGQRLRRRWRSKTIYESLYAKIHRRFSLDRSEFMLTFSHNHCGPVLKDDLVDYSLRFKREFGPTAWVCGYANDMAAYIPSRRVWKEGGYEGGPHLDEYGRPACR